MSEFFRALSKNPPAAARAERVSFSEAVADFARHELYARVVRPGDGGTTEGVAEAAGHSRATVYAQACGRNPVTYEIAAALADAGDFVGLAHLSGGSLIAGLAHEAGRGRVDAARDAILPLLRELSRAIGYAVQIDPQRAAQSPTIHEALIAITDGAQCCSETAALEYAKAHDGLDGAELVELEAKWAQEDRIRERKRGRLRAMVPSVIPAVGVDGSRIPGVISIMGGVGGGCGVDGTTGRTGVRG